MRETGLACPDLSLIAPLTKLLHISADELLGLAPEKTDEKLDEFRRQYDETFKTGDIGERLRITEEAVREYPGDMTWLNQYAWSVWCYAVGFISDNAAFEEEREKAIKLFETVIENTEDDAVKAYSITGIVQCLCGKGAKKEALRYAEMYPAGNIRAGEKETLLGMCLEGEEQLRHKQQYLKGYVDTLIDALIWKNIGKRADACAAAEAILAAMYPDGNYFDQHHAMCHIRMRQAEDACKAGDDDRAVTCMRQAMEHAAAYDDIDSVNPREFTLTSPLFAGLTFDSRQWCRTGTGTLTEDVQNKWNSPLFDALRAKTTL